MTSWKIGKVRVTKIVELEATGGTRFILPQATREAVLPIEWLKPHFMDDDGKLKMSIHALVIETPTRRMIVDTCLGNDKQGREVPGWNNLSGPFLRDLAAAGYPRESIDTVLCNGSIVWRDGKQGDGKAGRALKRQEMQAEARA